MDMIHYNNLAWWHEVNDETKEYFEIWEDFKTNPFCRQRATYM